MFGLNLNKERKYLLIGGIILLLIGFIYRMLPFFYSFQPAADEILLKKRNIIKYKQMVQKGNELDSKLMVLNRVLDRAESRLLTGKTPALAAVEIQNIINDITSRSDVDIKTTRVLKPEELKATNYLSIPLKFNISCTIRQLKEILYRIETSAKFILAREVRLRTVRRRNMEQIQSTLTVAGFMKKDEH